MSEPVGNSLPVLEGREHCRFISLGTSIRTLGLLNMPQGNEYASLFSMLHKRMTAFSKSANCPSSDNLLSFLNRRLTNDTAEEIREHLAVCDFCSAEADFYRHFPQIPDEQIGPSEIPSHLYQLAEALLTDGSSGTSSLRKMFEDDQGKRRGAS